MSPRARFSDWPRDFILLTIAVASVGAFFGVQLTLYNNFVVERLGIAASQLGFIEALRETPGLLNALLLAVLLRFSPPRTASLCLIVMGIGIMAYAEINSILSLALFSVLWSVGFHCYVPLQQAMSISFSPPGEKGLWLGRLRSAESAAWLAAVAVCYLTKRLIDYDGLFVMAGVTTIIGGAALLFTSSKPHIDDSAPKLLLRRRYGRFYVLNILQGCRKQIFITFAIFALVKIHSMPVETTIILVFINQVLVSLTAPWMGRMVDRHGERITLTISHILLVLVFCGYAVIKQRYILYTLFCLDSLLFVGSIALTTYANRITPSNELKATFSMGVTMNHLAAVLAPLVGGLAWQAYGYQWIFYSGAALAGVSIIVSWGMPKHVPARMTQDAPRL